MARRVLAILNPVSGRRDVRRVVHRVGRLIEKAGGAFEIVETTCAGHATEIASRVGPNIDCVLAIGLAKEPDDRFSSGQELADALEAATRGALSPTLRDRAAALLANFPWGVRR